MYNGIGLLTARGSGTNGYVQSNKFSVHHLVKADIKEYGEGDGIGGVEKIAINQNCEVGIALAKWRSGEYTSRWNSLRRRV